jgi:hypothetical protein
MNITTLLTFILSVTFLPPLTDEKITSTYPIKPETIRTPRGNQ